MGDRGRAGRSGRDIPDRTDDLRTTSRTLVTVLLLAQAQPEHGPGLRLQAQLLVHEPRRLADGGDLELEAADGTPGAAGRREVGAPSIACERLEVVLARAVGGDFRRRARDRRGVQGEVADLDAAEIAQSRVDEGARGIPVVRHEAAAVATSTRLHESLVAHALKRLAGGDDRDPEALGELGLARQSLAVTQHAGHDRVGEPLLDEFGAARWRRAARRRRRASRRLGRGVRHVCSHG